MIVTLINIEDMIMRKLLLLFILASTTAAASPGFTSCPPPSAFKYNSTANQMQAPGGWDIVYTGKVRVLKLLYAEAWASGGAIQDCMYTMVHNGATVKFPAFPKPSYVADNIKAPIWKPEPHTNNVMKTCTASNPALCSFHAGF